MDNILLIDGKNTVYRAAYAYMGNQQYGKYHPFVTWIKFVKIWLDKFKPLSCHIFWDCAKNDVWRKKILSEYKDNRHDMQHYGDDVQSVVNDIIYAAKVMLDYLCVRQYSRDTQECDDLIYAASRVLVPSNENDYRVVIISDDSDFTQIQWLMSHVKCFTPKNNKIVERPVCDPSVQKALCGDKADNIDGFRGIGPVKSMNLASDKNKLFEFLNSQSIDNVKFKKNLALIDMSMNPFVLPNTLYVMEELSKDVKFDKAKVNELAVINKINGLMGEMSNIVPAFKRLCDSC